MLLVIGDVVTSCVKETTSQALKFLPPQASALSWEAFLRERLTDFCSFAFAAGSGATGGRRSGVVLCCGNSKFFTDSKLLLQTVLRIFFVHFHGQRGSANDVIKKSRFQEGVVCGACF